MLISKTVQSFQQDKDRPSRLGAELVINLILFLISSLGRKFSRPLISLVSIRLLLPNSLIPYY